MSSSIPSNLGFGSFVPTTFIWEIQQIQSSNIDPNLKEVLVRLYQNINQMSLVLNTKDSALYVEEEFVCGQQYFSNPALTSTTSQSPTPRQVFRKVINFGELPNATSKSVAHGITMDSQFSLTRVYGAATNGAVTSLIPLPFASPVLADNIQLELTSTNVVVTTGVDRTTYTTSYVIIELIKQ